MVKVSFVDCGVEWSRSSRDVIRCGTSRTMRLQGANLAFVSEPP